VDFERLETEKRQIEDKEGADKAESKFDPSRGPTDKTFKL